MPFSPPAFSSTPAFIQGVKFHFSCYLFQDDFSSILKFHEDTKQAFLTGGDVLMPLPVLLDLWVSVYLDGLTDRSVYAPTRPGWKPVVTSAGITHKVLFASLHSMLLLLFFL